MSDLTGITEPIQEILGNGDPVGVLQRLAGAGYRLYGDYELKACKKLEFEGECDD